MKWNEIGKDEWGNVILGAPQFLPDPTLKYLGGVWSHFQGIGALTLLLFVPSGIQNSTEKMTKKKRDVLKALIESPWNCFFTFKKRYVDCDFLE